MRGLTEPTRRAFGRGLGAALALAGAPRPVRADAGPHEVEVAIARFAFAPARVEIRAGDAVVFVNADLAPHTATAADGTFDTGALERGGRHRVVFALPGAYSYACAFHPHMQGTVVVAP